jgi:uncharacterized membrane protein YidH (DUF202 family)
MSKSSAVFLALMSSLITVYLGAVAFFSDSWRSTEGDSSLVHAFWIAFGVGVIVTGCAILEASLRKASNA